MPRYNRVSTGSRGAASQQPQATMMALPSHTENAGMPPDFARSTLNIKSGIIDKQDRQKADEEAGQEIASCAAQTANGRRPSQSTDS